MAKKNFIEGLDDLLGDSVVEHTSTENKSDSSKKKRKSGKDFSADLESLLQGALEDSIKSAPAPKEKKKPLAKSSSAKRNRRIQKALTGLDALIRETVQTSQIEIQAPKAVGPKKKRVTFSFDKEKVEILKNIAKEEKSYIKDIVSEVVEEFIKEYEAKKSTNKKS